MVGESHTSLDGRAHRQPSNQVPDQRSRIDRRSERGEKSDAKKAWEGRPDDRCKCE